MDALMIAINMAGAILAAILGFQQVQQSVNKGSINLRGMASTVLVGSWLFLLSLATLIHCQHREVLGKSNVYLGLPAQAVILAIAYSGLKNNMLNATLAPLPSAQKAVLCFHISMAILCLTQMALIMACPQSSPRRPRHDKHGDRQSTHWRSLTFAWAKPILDLASVFERLQLQSLPSLWAAPKTSALTVDFNRAWSSHSGLILTLFRSHQFSCYLQWVLSGTLALSTLFSRIALLRLLQSIDTTSTCARLKRNESAVVLGLACIVQQMLESHLLWTSSSRLEIPIRAQLSCKIFERCLRRHSHSSHASAVATNASQISLPHDDKFDGIDLAELGTPSQQDERYDKVEVDKSARQDVVNLVGVDVPRVAEFAARQHVFLNISITVTASLGFLFVLIGWIPTLIGILGPLLLMPLNAAASHKYAQCQSKLMAFRDTRLSATKEALDGIRQIKFAGAEDRWQRKIVQQRRDELNEQRTAFRWTVILRVFWILSPILLAVLSLGSYAFIEGALNPAIAFTALATFSNLESALSLLPYGLIQSLDAFSSCARLAKYLRQPEQPDPRIPGSQVKLQNATIAWNAAKASGPNRLFTLRQVNCAFPSGCLSVVFGQSGTGKSLLLQAILGEASLVAGQLVVAKDLTERHQGHHGIHQKVTSSIAYVSSDPWHEAVSVRDAVLFGSPYQPKRYNEALDAVALGPDIEAMEHCDMTNIGIQGLRLSGGQRLRLSLARALYSQAQTIVIDDMFSALDTRTAQHVAKLAIMGSLTTGRTIVMASNQPERFLSDAAYAVELIHGRLARVYANNAECRTRHTSLVQTPTDSIVGRRHRGHGLSDQNVANDIGDQPEEHTETGYVPWSLYAQYSRAAGTPSFCTLALLTVGLSQAVFLGRNFALAVWTKQDARSKLAEPSARIQSQTSHLLAYLFLYVAISISAALLEGAKCWFFYHGSLAASEKLFEDTLAGLLHAPLQWFSKTPTGRIQNRMSADCALMDTKLPGDGHMLFSSVFGLLTLTLAGLLISPLLIIPEILLMMLGLCYSVNYLKAARGTRRLDAVTRSPVLDLLSSCSLGLSTIRAFGKEQYYLRRMQKLLDDQIRASRAFSLVYQWMDFRMGMIGSIFVLVIAMYIANLDVGPSLAGLVLTLALEYSAHAEEAISRYASLQVDMNAVERLEEYARLPSEDYSGASIPHDWPSHGHVAIRDLCASYMPGEISVLKRITIDIPAGSRIGIVGRTGAGKSSFAQAMLRGLHFSSGSIKIDGLNIQDVSLAELRAHICFVPQDPMLFAGTIRYNLDPAATLPDSFLIKALHDVGLAREPALDDTQSSSSRSAHQSFDLDFEVTERGQNLSRSQCQLICLARGLVRDARIVILDEATSSVDADIEDCIQTRLRIACSNSTLIVIAHRLSTILNLEQVAVMDAGRVVECGAPRDLYKARGAFHDLIQHSADAVKLQEMLVA